MKPSLAALTRRLLLVTLASVGLSFQAWPAAWTLATDLRVDSQGVLLSDVVKTEPALPPIRLADAPEVGKILFLSRARILAELQTVAPELTTSNWAGAAQIRITRRLRRLDEVELLATLTDTLQAEFVRDRGQLELKLTRPWPGVSIPDEPFTLKLTDHPASGVTARSLLRFELRGERELFGTWTVSADAKVWREVWVARSPLTRNTSVRDADLVRERRDVLTLFQPLAHVVPEEDACELSENVAAGSPIYARMLRVRPVIRRGKLVDALIRDGALNISVRVEALDDGAPGQQVRVRNLKSKREFRGKVQDEQTVIVPL
jgi:flagella basal body P-ring formation protein FlgA